MKGTLPIFQIPSETRPNTLDTKIIPTWIDDEEKEWFAVEIKDMRRHFKPQSHAKILVKGKSESSLCHPDWPVTLDCL